MDIQEVVQDLMEMAVLLVLAVELLLILELIKTTLREQIMVMVTLKLNMLKWIA